MPRNSGNSSESVVAILGAPADVAQLVERLLAMQKVDGSSPFIRFDESRLGLFH